MGTGKSKIPDIQPVRKRKQRRINDIERMLRYFNKPIVRKPYRPTTRTKELALPKVRQVSAKKESIEHERI